MSVAIEAVVPKAPPLRIDLFRPAFVLLVLVLAVLVVLPLSWLAYYSLVDKDGAFTLANFAALVNDVTLRKPFLVAIGMALGVGALSCAIATPLAWLVSRTDLPGRRVVRALVTASFVTPPFLGAIAWEILAAPNSGLINVAYRALSGGRQLVVRRTSPVAPSFMMRIRSWTGSYTVHSPHRTRVSLCGWQGSLVRK